MFMYGQTEATARMSFLSPDKAMQKPYAIGQAIPYGYLWLEDENEKEITTANTIGQLCYSGPNVMLGLAENCEDLKVNQQQSKLKTGDLAERDEEGDYTIVGRLKRFIKIVGKRINLAEIDHFLYQQSITAVSTGIDNHLMCFIVKTPDIEKSKT